jgi:hypothetical protein
LEREGRGEAEVFTADGEGYRLTVLREDKEETLSGLQTHYIEEWARGPGFRSPTTFDIVRRDALQHKRRKKRKMKLSIDFDTANDSLPLETDEDSGLETRIVDHWITPCLPFKNAMRIVLTELIQPDGTVTYEWHGEICADDPFAIPSMGY